MIDYLLLDNFLTEKEKFLSRTGKPLLKLTVKLQIAQNLRNPSSECSGSGWINQVQVG